MLKKTCQISKQAFTDMKHGEMEGKKRSQDRK